MKKNDYLVTIVVISTTAFAWLSNMPAAPSADAVVLADAREFTEDLYQQLIIAENHYQDDPYMGAYEQFKNKFSLGPDQILPNDFKRISKAAGEDRQLVCRKYFELMGTLSNDNVINGLNYRITKVVPVSKPKFDKNESPSFVNLIVEKKISDNKGKNHFFNDTIYFHVDIRKISDIYNDVFHNPIHEAYNNNEHYNLLQANIFFDEERYEMAYKAFKDVAEREKNGDAYYRLSIMTYEGKGCKNIPKKKRMKLTMDYIQNAKYYGDYKLVRLVENFEYWVR